MEPVNISICRICFESETSNYNNDDTRMNRMICPCKCNGSIKWIHRLCLDEWIRQSRNMICPQCRHTYECRQEVITPWIFWLSTHSMWISILFFCILYTFHFRYLVTIHFVYTIAAILLTLNVLGFTSEINAHFIAHLVINPIEACAAGMVEIDQLIRTKITDKVRVERVFTNYHTM